MPPPRRADWLPMVGGVLLGLGFLGIVWAPSGIPALLITVVCSLGVALFLASNPARSGLNVERDLPPGLAPDLAARAKALRAQGRLVIAPMWVALVGALSSSWFRSHLAPYDRLLAGVCTAVLVLVFARVYVLRRRFRALVVEAKQRVA